MRIWDSKDASGEADQSEITIKLRQHVHTSADRQALYAATNATRGVVARVKNVDCLKASHARCEILNDMDRSSHFRSSKSYCRVNGGC